MYIVRFVSKYLFQYLQENTTRQCSMREKFKVGISKHNLMTIIYIYNNTFNRLEL